MVALHATTDVNTTERSAVYRYKRKRPQTTTRVCCTGTWVWLRNDGTKKNRGSEVDKRPRMDGLRVEVGVKESQKKLVRVA